MSELTLLFGIYKIEKGIDTDEALAKCLHVQKTALSNYKAGRRRLPDTAIVELAEVTGQPVENVLAIANASFSGTPAIEMPFWLERIDSISQQLRNS